MQSNFGQTKRWVRAASLSLALGCGGASAAAKGLEELQATEANAAVPEPQSELGKTLAEKLSFVAAFGMRSVSGSEGEWGSAFGTSIGASYAFMEVAGLSLAGVYRYAPVDVVVSGVARGVVESYALGVDATMELEPTMRALGSAELSYTFASMDPLVGDRSTVSKFDGEGAVLGLGGGLDWKVQERFWMGPRLMLGFGYLTSIEASIASRFVF